eukprot:TRINITY_DN1489_c0_g1_i1.p1 TRINITY_DN1489_c0_g1~~TRINITY_DN1489_c0_g1_i1.p1  ORF type:complete len:266 (-),score=59.54 TRINITY_DN1489_c0_g1_i1:102-899(-)
MSRKGGSTWDPDGDQALFDEKFVVKNLDTGEKMNVTSVPKNGVIGKPDEQKKEIGGPNTFDKKLASTSSTDLKKSVEASSLRLIDGESSIVGVEIFMTGMDKSKKPFTVRVKTEETPRFASMNTVKLNKGTWYKFRIVLNAPQTMKIASLEEIKMEDHRAKIKTETAKATGNSFEVEAEWMLPSAVIATPDAIRHSMPVSMTFKVARADPKIKELSTITFKENIQSKIYTGELQNVLTGSNLRSVSTSVNIKTQESISGISYNLS